jgi:hypothetical protein
MKDKESFIEKTIGIILMVALVFLVMYVFFYEITSDEVWNSYKANQSENFEINKDI